MKPAPPRFNRDELDIMRVLDRRGLSLAEWREMPEDDQIDELAYQLKIQWGIQEVFNLLDRRAKNDKTNDLISYVAVLLSKVI